MNPISSSAETAIAEDITQPYYLAMIDFDTPEYITSTKSNISYGGDTYVAAPLEVDPNDEPVLTIFNEGTTLGDTILADGIAGRTIKIYRGYRNDANHPNPSLIFEGEGGPAEIGEYVTIECRRSKPVRTPRHYCVPPVMNHLPTPGTRFRTPKGVVILED